MVSKEFEKERDKLFEKIKKSDELEEGLKERIINLYGNRGKKAIDVVEKDGIEKKGDKWLVKGSEEKYEVVKKFCSCKDYVLNITTEKADVDMCYHALAKNIYRLLRDQSI